MSYQHKVYSLLPDLFCGVVSNDVNNVTYMGEMCVCVCVFDGKRTTKYFPVPIDLAGKYYAKVCMKHTEEAKRNE